MSVLEASAVAVSIGDTRVCNDLNLRIAKGERWCILGRNGSGKTTLLHTLAGLRQTTRGYVKLDGQPLDALHGKLLSRHIGVLLQDHHDMFPASVLETVLSGRHPWLGSFQWEDANDYRIARAALKAVGLADMEIRNVATLSGGERRRLGIATLLTQDTAILLLDEPTNHLDINYQIQTLDLLKRQSIDAGKSLLLVMHDINLALRYCNCFLLLFGDGEYALGSAAQVITEASLDRLYQYPLQSLQGPDGPVWLPR
ncbi:MAG: ABC transporter ATP-binding protein [Gammaproteobacteria bacterium]